MSTTSGASSRPQRSSSASRSSRRATLSVGAHGGGAGTSLGNGSLSPQRAMRTRVLRERSNDPGSDVGAAGKHKEPTSIGATRAQQMQFAFGSKIIKPSSSKAGMSAVGAGMPTRGRTNGVAADAGNAIARPRRERTVRHESQEQQQRAISRGRGAIRAEQQQQPTGTSREQADSVALKVQLEEQKAIIADLRRKLAKEAGAGPDARSDAPAARSASDTLKDAVDEGEQATLRAVEEEARAEAEEKLARVEAVAGAGLAHLSEMQGRVDEML
eukprot:g3622.t1